MKTKGYRFLALALLVVIVVSCSPYKRTIFSSSDLYLKGKIKENIESYDVIVHQDGESYVLEEAKISNDSLIGVPKKMEVVVPDPVPFDSTAKAKTQKDDLNDIHVFVQKSYDDVVNKLGEQLGFSETDIDHIEMFAKKRDGTMTTIGIILLIVLAVLVILLLILLVTVSASGSGNSGSDSDSGGSDSGCYVATMTYGSYDAPEVLTLRTFRDKFLQKSALGRAFIRWYYKNSPGWVARHESKQWLHSVLRFGLNGFVSFLRLFYK